ncbi:unnamed protein product [Paramecium octaurelia]|uniref:Uncharacterized protein n=1 Tax=Paramecium octaurelia TaxID=43137 RepID=A0A8S1X2J0_PAROT|nr:unnamed protein product [Paramecium octaurelia]
MNIEDFQDQSIALDYKQQLIQKRNVKMLIFQINGGSDRYSVEYQFMNSNFLNQARYLIEIIYIKRKSQMMKIFSIKIYLIVSQWSRNFQYQAQKKQKLQLRVQY